MVTLLPALIIDIIETIVEVDESKEDARHHSNTGSHSSGIIVMGVLFMIFTIVFTIFCAHILWSYEKYGSEDLVQRNAPQNAYPAQNANQPAPGRPVPMGGVMVGSSGNTNNIRPNHKIDEEALEGKDPKAAAQKMKGVEPSLNGGMNTDSGEENQDYDDDNNMSNEDTPPDIDQYQNNNKVVDHKEEGEQNPNANQKPFPVGKFA